MSDAVEIKSSGGGKAGSRRKRAAAAAMAGVLLISGLTGCSAKPPVIQGVVPELEVREGDELRELLLEGVTSVAAEGEEPAEFPVEVHIYNEAGEEVTEVLPGSYRLVYTSVGEKGTAADSVESTLVVLPADREAPVITGAADIMVTQGDTVSYRAGITVTDNVDETVRLKVDATAVDTAVPGTYPVTYSAVDAQGNAASITVSVIVEEAPVADIPEDVPQVKPAPQIPYSLEALNTKADQVLGKIITPGMSKLQQVNAVYDYLYSHIRYVSTSDKSDWRKGAWVGLTQGKGDCFNYYAASKLLLGKLNVPTVDMRRVGGNTNHYWLLANAGSGYYHFDPCWHPAGYNTRTCMITEAEARAFTASLEGVRKNYYVYDYDACPVIAVGTPEEEAAARLAKWEAAKNPAPVEPTPEAVVTPMPTTPVEPMPEMTPDPLATVEPTVAPVEPTPGTEPVAPSPEVVPGTEVTPAPVAPVESSVPVAPGPEATPAPVVTPAPEATPAPVVTAEPVPATPAPEVLPQPEATPVPAPETVPAGEPAAGQEG